MDKVLWKFLEMLQKDRVHWLLCLCKEDTRNSEINIREVNFNPFFPTSNTNGWAPEFVVFLWAVRAILNEIFF